MKQENDKNQHMKYLFAPGCALVAYKPHLAEKLKAVAERKFGKMDTLLTCCMQAPAIAPGTCILTPCATCAGRYEKYQDCSVLSLLSCLAEDEEFPLPDYHGLSMSIQDTCAARTRPEELAAVRHLLKRMRIRLVEPERTGIHAKCCGQVGYGKLEISKVENMMKKRAGEMPCEEVVVYCASCIMSMQVGGKRPRYILDLLFCEPTDMKQESVVKWNRKLQDFRKMHAESSPID